MKKESKEFLKFNGTNINILSVDGQYYVAIKPICEVLGVHYRTQYDKIIKHRIYGQLCSSKSIVAKDNRVREMLCLPERYIYGWLLGIDSDSEELFKYQLECHDVLYNYFHGATTERLQLLKFKSAEEIALEEAELKWKEEMLASENYRNVQKLKFSLGGTNKGLKVNDDKLLEGQLKMFGE
jgi:hypothetical protein